MKTRKERRGLPAAILAFGLLPVWHGHGQTSTLEQRVEVLEQQQKDGPKFTANGRDGFSLSEGPFRLKLGGYVQVDSRWYSGEDASKFSDTFLLRRVRPIFDGKLGEDASFRIMPDFSGNSTTLQDAYIDISLSGKNVLRAGKFKQPFGLERLQSGTNLRFVERGFPTSLAPNRDVGLQISAPLFDGVVEYAVGVFNGTTDGGSVVSDSDDGKDAVGRLWLSPFKNTESAVLQGLSFGIAASFGDADGNGKPSSTGQAGANSGLAGFRTVGQNAFFSYLSSTNEASTVYADGERTRFSPQLTWYAGPVGLLAEYVQSDQEVSKGDASETLSHSAWQVAVSWIVTGEKNSFRGVTPTKSFAPSKGDWGAFELAARFGELEADDAAFPVFADIKRSASSTTSWGVGATWYWTRNLKWQAGYDVTSFEGGAASGDRPDEEVAFTRVQVAF